MKLLHVHPSDRAWLRRWLRSNVSFFVVATTLLIAVQYQPEMPLGPRVSASDGDLHRGDSRFAATEPGPPAQGQPNSVAPQGWRRTSDGWEHVSTWPSIKSINQLIAEQHDLEPEWIRVVFGKLRRISPLMVALLQITAIATIVNVAKSRVVTDDPN
jgi:hypothetical protein